MDATIDALATASRVDGMKFLFHRWESDRMIVVYERTFDLIQKELGLATAEVERVLKFKTVRHQTSDKGSLYSMTLFGDAARLYDMLPFEWALHLAEMHFKCFLVEHFPGAYEGIADAVWQSAYAVNVTIIKSRVRDKHSKGTGEKGLRLGSRKNDKHSVIYRRSNERPGFETRTADELVRRTVRQVRADRDALRATATLTDADCWHLLHRKLASAGYAAAMRHIRAMGVNLGDYVSGVTNHPDPSLNGDVMPIDQGFEASFQPKA